MASVYERLNAATAAARAKFMDLPLVQSVLGPAPQGGGLADSGLLLPIYRRYLRESYHHVRVASQTYALAGSRIPDEDEPIRRWLLTHAMEEYGHHDWILSDLKALGIDPESVRRSKPSPPCAALVGYMYYTAGIDNPIGLLGDSYVVEGLSQLFASQVAGTMKELLGIPDAAVTYLARHGTADQGHMDDLRNLINGHIRREQDLGDVIQVARVEFELYGLLVEEAQKGDLEG
jgi:pyrroloquinoline quinone (PQQ) biosynthesis protein C